MIRIAPKYSYESVSYYGVKVGKKYTILRESWDKNGLTVLTARQAELSLGTIVSI
jgi:hypothetical protein